MELEIQTLKSAFVTLKGFWPKAKPRWGLVLGSGWGDVASLFDVKESLSYDQIPGFGHASVQGHAGKLLYGSLSGVDTFVFQGRRHWYEGAGWTPVLLPVFLLKQMGAESVFLTNASGGIQSGFKAGDLMLIDDHINVMGRHPLVGPHHPELGPRFPDQTCVYDPVHRERLLQAAAQVQEPLQRGVYLAVSGPCYESPAEVQMFKKLGADAVGMSTVPEATVAAAMGLRVLGLSCICNLAAGISPTPLSHEEVAAVGASVTPRVKKLLAQFWDLSSKQNRSAHE